MDFLDVVLLTKLQCENEIIFFSFNVTSLSLTFSSSCGDMAEGNLCKVSKLNHKRVDDNLDVEKKCVFTSNKAESGYFCPK